MKIMELYHVVNRGVDQREIFLDGRDYLRFLYDLFEFNDQKNLNTATRIIAVPYDFERHAAQHGPRSLLVDLHAFCLMPNHYHLLVSPRVEQGLPRFIKKLNMGYARYFNERNDRKGALFQGKYKRILVEHEAHFAYLPFYIHLNPLDLVAPEWRQGKVQNIPSAMNYLEQYRWSSLLDYLGQKNFPSVTSRDFLSEVVGNPSVHRRGIEDWIGRGVTEASAEESLLLE